MSTVLGELTLEFTDATVIHIVELPIEPHLVTLDTAVLPVTLWLLGVDLPPLTALWGPLLDMSWHVALVPDAVAVVPLPASVWMLAAALAALFLRAKRSRSKAA